MVSLRLYFTNDNTAAQYHNLSWSTCAYLVRPYSHLSYIFIGIFPINHWGAPCRAWECSYPVHLSRSAEKSVLSCVRLRRLYPDIIRKVIKDTVIHFNYFSFRTKNKVIYDYHTSFILENWIESRETSKGHSTHSLPSHTKPSVEMTGCWEITLTFFILHIFCISMATKESRSRTTNYSKLHIC